MDRAANEVNTCRFRPLLLCNVGWFGSTFVCTGLQLAAFAYVVCVRHIKPSPARSKSLQFEGRVENYRDCCVELSNTQHCNIWK